jgi:hypothetical protein
MVLSCRARPGEDNGRMDEAVRGYIDASPPGIAPSLTDSTG